MGNIDKKIEYLAEFMTPERFDVLRETLSFRTRYITLCTENTFHSQNASALIRNCEAFGLQDIYTVENLCTFSPNVNIVRGSDKWIDIHRFGSSSELLTELRSKGYRIVATSPHADDFTPESFDVEAGPFALFFGTEHEGISREVIDSADQFIKIPMCGFVESLNVSASAAILLYILTTRLRRSDIDWRLPSQEYEPILFRWMMESVRESEKIMARFPGGNF